MLFLAQQERGVWLCGAQGGATWVSPQEWNQASGYLAATGLIPLVEIGPGGAGPAAHLVMCAMFQGVELPASLLDGDDPVVPASLQARTDFYPDREFMDANAIPVEQWQERHAFEVDVARGRWTYEGAHEQLGEGALSGE
jgi:hypothetical protein